MVAEQGGTVEHKNHHQIARDDEHCKEEDDSDFQQAGVEDLRIANVQKAEGHGALV